MRTLDWGEDEHRRLRLRLDHHVICVVCDCTLDTYAAECCAEPGHTCPGVEFLKALRQQVRDQDPKAGDPAPKATDRDPQT